VSIIQRRECSRLSDVKWLFIRYHLNTSHGICTSGKRFADPLDKRTLADGSVEFLCHECYKYKHIHRYAQDDIHTWYRHAAQVKFIICKCPFYKQFVSYFQFLFSATAAIEELMRMDITNQNVYNLTCD
jgi:hypothetical protein